MSDKFFERERLLTFTQNVFTAIGFSESDAATAAEVLLMADMRGIDSHGVARLSGYVRLWEAGRLNANPQMTLIREKLSAGTLEADRAAGLVSAPYAMKVAIEKAKKSGSGWIAVKNSNHFGIAAYHSLMAAREGMIGFAFTNASPLVSPFQSKERMLGTNPICVAIPAGNFPPFVSDMATSAAANGKLEIAQRAGKPIHGGWLLDKQGNESRNPADLKAGGALLPLGYSGENGHKGYALGAMVDILSGVLSGASFGPWVPPFVAFLQPKPDQPGEGIGHLLGAIDPEAFMDKTEFLDRMDLWIERFKAAEPAPGYSEVLIPGEPEYRTEQERIKTGIPLVEDVLQDLTQLAEKFGLGL